VQRAFQSICVLGLGYIGLPTASVIAANGVKVIGVDVQQSVVDKINRGEIHIIEPDLDAVTARVVQRGVLHASTEPQEADAFIIAVPTPFHDNTADLSYVFAAAESIAPKLRAGNLVILESTSPPGTTEMVIEKMAAKRPDLRFPKKGATDADIFVAYCPERVLPGRVLTELVENDRIIGGISAECSERAAALYRIFCKGELLVTDSRTAELCKLTENSFRDVNIAFANELSLVCDKLGINVWELIRLSNHHPRVKILQPGPGVGGHCIAVDPWFIVEAAPEQARLIRTAREINDNKPHWVLDKVKSAIGGHRGGRPRIAVLGLSFKPDVDDLRESPALHIATMLAELENSQLLISEPYVDSLPKELAGRSDVTLVEDLISAVAEADIVLMLVNHRQYYEMPAALLDGKVIIDTRGVWT
jgi:UDP-N-acetyl-D-mannosaminuronic acid dehydrogenase